jgi:hypothetical protein
LNARESVRMPARRGRARSVTGLILLLTGCVLAGCAPSLDVPPGYVKMRQPGGYDLKAVSARGSVIALTARPNEDASADLTFWSQAVEHQKVDLDGLRLAGREPIKTNTGLDGVLFSFELGEGQGKVAYLVALYVTPQRIYTVEVGGPADAIAGDMDKLRQAIVSLRSR